MLQCSIPPLYCHDYDTNSVKWLRSVIKPTHRMEDERASSPDDLVFFNKTFSFIFSFVRKRSQTKLFTANEAALSKLSPRKASWPLPVRRKRVRRTPWPRVRACRGSREKMNWIFKGPG